MGRTVHKAFDLRQEGDYREYQELEPNHIGQLLEQADAFVCAVRQYLEKYIFSNKLGWSGDYVPELSEEDNGNKSENDLQEG
jgi:hypothetical protein